MQNSVLSPESFFFFFERYFLLNLDIHQNQLIPTKIVGHVIDYCSRISDALHSSMAGAGQENRSRREGIHTGKEWMKLSEL